MESKIFSKNKNKIKIKIRKLSGGDLKKAKGFQDFINSVIEEGAQIMLNKKLSLKEERKWLEDELKKIRNCQRVCLVAEINNVVIGVADIELGRGRQNHVGTLGISLRKDYRGIGLGSYLMEKMLKLAEKELKPKPKIIRLGVFPTNKTALSLYKKFGFKKVAKIPEQLEYLMKL